MDKREDLFKKAEDIEKEKKERLIKEHGIYYFEKEDPETGEKKRYVNIMGIEIETEATKEDIDKIKENLVMSELDQELLRKMAEAYVLRQPLMLEGAPAAGKTFLIKYFTKLLYGADALPLTIYGTTRTDAEDIIGHWVPKTTNEKEKKIWNEFLETLDGKRKMQEVINELKGKKDLSEEQRQNIIQEKLKELAKSIGLTTLSEFEFKEGPLLRAYSGDNGQGYILDVEEMGVMPTNIQETFLPIGGESGKLAESIQFWGNGKEVYHRGPKTWIVFASNPPEEVGARHEVTTPMASRLTWIRIEKEKISPKVENLIDFLYTKGKIKSEIKPENVLIPVEKPIDIQKYPELAKVISLAVKTFHDAFIKWYDKVGEPDRNQKFEIGAREALRVLDNILKFQYRGEDGEIDLTISLKRAIELYYIDRLSDTEAKEKMRELFEAILGGGESELLGAGAPTINGKTIAEKLKEEIENIIDPEIRKKKLIKEIEEKQEKIWQVPPEFVSVGEGDLELKVNEYQDLIKKIELLKNEAINEENSEKASEILKEAIDLFSKLESLEKELKEMLGGYETFFDDLKGMLDEI